MAIVNERVRVDFGTIASVIVLERSDIVSLENPLPLYVRSSRHYCTDIFDSNTVTTEDPLLPLLGYASARRLPGFHRRRM